MRRGARRLLVPLLVLGALTLGVCGWRSDVAASVDGTDIGTEGLAEDARALLGQPDFASLYLNTAAPSGSSDVRLPTAALAVLLDRRINEVLVQRELAARNITVSDADLQAAEADLLEQLGQQGGGQSDLLSSFSNLPESLRTRLIRAEAAATALRSELAAGELATFPADARAYYDAHPEAFAQYCLSSIPVSSEDEGKALIRQTEGGTTLADLVARQKGQSEGCLPGNQLDQLPAQLASDLRASEPGDVVGPIEAQSGLLLVGLTSRDVPPYDQVAADAPVQYRVARAAAEDPAWRAWLSTQEPDVTVDPRYGTWNAERMQVEPPAPPRSS